MFIPFGCPVFDESEKVEILKTLDSGLLVHGPISTMFEDMFCEFTGAKHAISVSSCTAGLHLFYFVNGIGPGDEVIVPAQTHVATAHAVEFVGAKPVFVDVNSNTGNICPAELLKKLTEKTKAISVVHYLGAMVEIDEIAQIAKERNILLLEDCALAVGTKHNSVHSGLFGNAGVFSFYPVKHITTGEGGMIITNDDELANKLRFAKAFGVDRHHGERKVPGDYEVRSLGFNYRMSELHAALGVAQMKKVSGFLSQRKLNFGKLEGLLSAKLGLTVLPQPFNVKTQSSFYCLSFLLPENLIQHRSKIMSRLTDFGVGSSIYYPKPVPEMLYYKAKYSYRPEEFPNAKNLSERSIALPVGPHLVGADMDKIFETLALVLKEEKYG